MYVLNPMDAAELRMSPTSACWCSLQSSVPVKLELSSVRASWVFQFLAVQNAPFELRLRSMQEVLRNAVMALSILLDLL